MNVYRPTVIKAINEIQKIGSPGSDQIATSTIGVEQNLPEKQQENDRIPHAKSVEKQKPSSKRDEKDLISHTDKERDEQVPCVASRTPV